MMQASENSTLWPVRTENGQHFVRRPNGEDALITLRGDPAELPSGWTPMFLYAGFEPLYLLALIHESSTESTWFLDQSMDRIEFDEPAKLPPFEAAILRLKGQDLLKVFWHQLLCSHAPQFSPDILGFLQLGGQIRQRVCRFCEDGMKLTPRALNLEVAYKDNATFTIGDGTRIQVNRLREILLQDAFANICSSIPGGTLRWDSPIGDGFVETDKGLWITHWVMAYRLIDQSGGPVTYILVSSHPTRVIGIYLPAAEIVFQGHAPPEAFLGLPIETAFLRHICEYGSVIEQAWRQPATGFSVVYTARYISNQIWHDLTGIDRMARNIPREHLPEIVGMWGLPEVYGDTEDLYPETRGRLNRSFNTLDDLPRLIHHAYATRRCLLTLTHTYVTRDLYTRIIDLNTQRLSLHQQRNTLAQIKAVGCPVILLGLRVESRTVVDLTEFCVRIIEFLLEEAGKAVIVIDAHNGAGDDGTAGVFESKHQHAAREQPIDVERRIASFLRETFKGRPVGFIDNVGAPMSHSIFWCHHSDFFISFYGTGLAKYRWACNKTGLIITSKWTLRHQPQLHIYEAGCLEDASPLRFLPEEYVTDEPDDPVLVPEPGNPPARWNFRVRDEGVFKELRALLDASGHGHR